MQFRLTCLCLSVMGLLTLMAAKPGDSPQWRGKARDGHATASNLIREWPDVGPKVVWQVKNVGVGYSALSVADGRVFTQGDIDGVEHVLALSEKDGSLLWAVQPEPAAKKLDQLVATQFDRFDKNKDGKLSQLEALESLGWNFNKADAASEGDVKEIAIQRTAKLLAALDKNSDGAITYDEAPSTMMREFVRLDSADPKADPEKLAKERADTLIESFDSDGNEIITLEEAAKSYLRRMFGQMDERDRVTRRGDNKLTAAEIQKYFERRERGRDGRITAKEMESYFARTFPGRDGILEIADLKRYYGGYRNGQGDGPRGTPTVDGDRVYSEGGFGDLTCLDVATGKTIWAINMPQDLKGGRPGWGYSESPLIDGDLLIVTPGGSEGTIAALDKKTGKVVWRSTELKDRAHYASAIVADVEGVRQVIQFTQKRVVGVDIKDGRLLWSYSNSANGTANCATPIYSDGFVFSASAYGTGGGLARISRSGSVFSAEEVYFEKAMSNHHGGIILVDDYMYGFGSGGLICMNFKTGKIAWRNRSVTKGSICFADGDLYCLGERNLLALVEANSEEYIENGRISLPSSGRRSWAHPVVANGRLYIRDQGSLTCYRIADEP